MTGRNVMPFQRRHSTTPSKGAIRLHSRTRRGSITNAQVYEVQRAIGATVGSSAVQSRRDVDRQKLRSHDFTNIQLGKPD